MSWSSRMDLRRHGRLKSHGARRLKLVSHSWQVGRTSATDSTSARSQLWRSQAGPWLCVAHCLQGHSTRYHLPCCWSWARCKEACPVQAAFDSATPRSAAESQVLQAECDCGAQGLYDRSLQAVTAQTRLGTTVEDQPQQMQPQQPPYYFQQTIDVAFELH